MLLLDLPPELFEPIVYFVAYLAERPDVERYFHDERHLINLSLVNRSLRELAQRQLFAAPHVYSPSRAAARPQSRDVRLL